MKNSVKIAMVTNMNMHIHFIATIGCAHVIEYNNLNTHEEIQCLDVSFNPIQNISVHETMYIKVMQDVNLHETVSLVEGWQGRRLAPATKDRL